MTEQDNAPLLTKVDAFVVGLLDEASTNGSMDVDAVRPSFEARTGLLGAVTRYLAVKNKLDPTEEPESPIAQFAASLNGGARRRGGDRPAPKPTASGNLTERAN